MRNSFKPNDFLPTAIQQEGKDAGTPTEAKKLGDSSVGTGLEFAWETPWSSAGETEPGWWQAFALSKGVRATRTPDRFIKKQPETNVVALPAHEGVEAARMARAADKSCEDTIRNRLERLQAAVEARATDAKTPERAERSLASGARTVPVAMGAAASTEEVAEPSEVHTAVELEAASYESIEPEMEIWHADEEAAHEHPADLLPVPVTLLAPAFSAFAFQSGLYDIAVFLKPEAAFEPPMEAADQDEVLAAVEQTEDEAELIQVDPSEENLLPEIEPEEEVVFETIEAAPVDLMVEEEVEDIDAGYLALYGEDIAPVRASVEVAAPAQPEIAPSEPVAAIEHDETVSFSAGVTAQVIDFPVHERAKSGGYELPDIDLLAQPPEREGEVLTEDILEERAGRVEKVIRDFGVKGEVIHVHPGPVVTLYELEPPPGTKSNRIISLTDDIARSMSAVSARVAVVQGRNAIGIELPNTKRETVYLRELLASHDFEATKQKLALCLGKTIGGEPVIADLARMPHLLVAGTTGSGKSVAINTMILSILYRLKPEECRLIMVDPKMLELSVYDGIPHLLTPVVTDPKKAVIALKWAVREMEERYKKMSKLGVRNIDGFNERFAEARAKGEVITRTVQTGFDRHTGEATYADEAMELDPLPYIVVIVDEMADLMMVAGKDIEGAIQRLAQMARAAGIHLIMATQRPSVDVITGTI
ncbi:MAG: FtsK/SpoIIIE domain-containing protein, partial [Pseudomonadota bacterium]|nr:FtsK/SpoIIIE domain-containing protein [Pseudomonadota bacterium]